MEPTWIYVTVHVRASKEVLITHGDGRCEAWVTVKPIEGHANEAVKNLLVRHLGIARDRLLLVKGRHRRHKVFKVI